MRIFSRRRWKARAPRAMASQNSFSQGGFVHWTDSATKGVDSFAEQAAAMRSIQDFHMDPEPNGRGWSDIGYHYIVFQPAGKLRRARVFEARNPSRVPAAQQGHNTNSLAVAVYMGPGDTLKASTKRAVLRVMRKHGIDRKHIKCHKDVFSTDCPGPSLTRWVRSL